MNMSFGPLASTPLGPTETTPAAVSPAAAIANAVRLLASNPEAAERQAKAVLKVLPTDGRALYVIGAARRRLGDLDNAKRILIPLAAAKYESPEVHFELGLTLAEAGERAAAIQALRRAADLGTSFAEAWLALSEQLYLAGDKAGATEAYDEHIRTAIKDPDLLAAVTALREGRLNDGNAKLRVYLRANPGDLGAARLLAETLARLMRFEEAELILAHCVRLAPGFMAARQNYAQVLYELNKPEQAIEQLEKLLEWQPNDPKYLSPLAASHVLATDYDKATPLFDRLIAKHPDDAKVLLNYGQSMRIIGKRAEAVAAFRRAAVADPNDGDAYWSLADLKIDALEDSDIAAMLAKVERPDLPTEARVAFHYALGKAYEERRAWQASFDQYAQGARLWRTVLPNDPEQNTAYIDRLKRGFTAAFFAERADWGCPDAAPIFIVGLPRAGSTLLEQILASHSEIEATAELAHIFQMSKHLHTGATEDTAYPRSLEHLSRQRFAELGEQYIAACAKYRKRGKARFIDKMPGNFQHIGLIKLILPNARIIDIRRDPMGGCFSVFKQYFFRGQNFSYDLTEAARYYRDYLSLMTHYEHVLPGFAHRIHYDELVDDAEREVRRALAYLGLDYQETCLNFWRSGRPVPTHSSEQVRRPIYRDAVELWRNYEPWLGPLRDALGDALDTWKQQSAHPAT